MKIDFYIHTTWGEYVKQLALIPTIFITTNNYERTRFSVLSISFLFWDFGITYYKQV